MATSNTPGTDVGQRIEVDPKENHSLPRGTAEAEWHVPDNHRQTLSFTDVRLAGISVRNLEVEVGIAPSFVDTLKARFTKSEVRDVEGGAADGARRKILKGVSADFPAGSLTAIIGGSGSGKVCLHLCACSTLGGLICA